MIDMTGTKAFESNAFVDVQSNARAEAAKQFEAITEKVGFRERVGRSRGGGLLRQGW